MGRVPSERPECPGGLRKVLQRVAGSGRSRGRGAGRPGEAAFPAPRSRSPAAAGAGGGRAGAGRRTLCRCPPSPLRFLSSPRRWGRRTPSARADTPRRGRSDFPPGNFLPPAAGDRGPRSAVLSHRPLPGTIWIWGVFLEGVFLFSCLPLPVSLSAPLSAFHSLSVSNSVSFSLWFPQPSGSPCFSLVHLPAFLGMSLCACYSVSSACLSVLPYFLPFDACLCLSHLPCLVLPNLSSQIPRRRGQGNTS